MRVPCSPVSESTPENNECGGEREHRFMRAGVDGIWGGVISLGVSHVISLGGVIGWESSLG